MRTRWLIAIVAGVLAVGAAAFVVALLVVKVLWAWVIPDIFPGAVEQGLVAARISWFTALKVAILLAVLAGPCGMSASWRHKNR